MQLRRQHRIAYQTRIRLRTPDRDDSVVARVQNLSPHGVFVTASDLPDAGTEVICRLDLGGQHRTVRGRVAWVRQPSAATPDKSPGAGIEFLDLDEKDAELLNRVVEPDPRDSKPVDVWFEGMAAPIRCQAAVLGEGVRLATRLPFLRLNSTVRVSFGPNGGGNEEGTLDAVVLEPSSEDGVPRLQLNVSLLSRESTTAATAPEIDLDADPALRGAIADTSGEEPPEATVHDVSASSDIGTAFPHELPELASPPELASAATLDPEEEPTGASLPASEPPLPRDPGAEISGDRPTALEARTETDLDRERSFEADAEPGVEPDVDAITATEAEAAPDAERAADFNSAAGEHTPIEPPVEGASPLVSHMVRLGPPPLPALRHRRQAPDSDKTPTVSDASSPQTIPPMTLSAPLSQAPRRRINIWGLAAVALAAVGILAVVNSQRRTTSTAAVPPPPPPAARPEATPLNRPAEQPAAPESKPAAAAAKPPAAAPAGTISQAPRSALTVEASGTTSIFTFPLVGSSRGARRQLLTQPPGVTLLMPRGRPKAQPGTYKPAGELLTVQVNRKGSGSEVRFMYDPENTDARMELDSRKVTLMLTRKQ